MTTLQWYAGAISLLAALVIMGIALMIARPRTQLAFEAAAARVYAARRTYFLILVPVLILALAITIPQAPYAETQDRIAQLSVKATSRMWTWNLTPPVDREGKEVRESRDGHIVIPRGQPVQFDVTSEDVNHSFALFDSRGRLIGQTQAMPGYTNRLIVTFDEPGQYYVVCLEYCGLAHHLMSSGFEVE